jgi:hypothetical protein
MKIAILNKEFEEKYEKFLLSQKNSLFYASSKYRFFLKELLQSKDVYFLAIDEQNNIRGILPAFLKENSKTGNVLNSLPFYGSNGGIIAQNDEENIKIALINAFNEFAELNNCVSTTIITSPLEENIDFYEKRVLYKYKDARIGQLINMADIEEPFEDNFLGLIESTARRNIKKAVNSSVTVKIDNAAFEFLENCHIENMSTIGGSIKSHMFFSLIPKYFEAEMDYNIYVAEKDGENIAALLVFYFNKTVEYFTPVISEAYRSDQPLALIVKTAIIDAKERNFEWWNWGGTWLTQDGVYKFKKKWGTQDKPYFYYTKIFDDKILNMTKETLLSEYPYFFVLPFWSLKS